MPGGVSPGSRPPKGSQGDGDSSTGGAGWRLPRGPHKLPREVVADHQRQRLLAAVAQAVAEEGYAGMTVEHVLVLAGVSRTTFYENFDNKRECVLVAHEQAFSRLSGELVAACAGESEWAAKLVAAIGAAVEFATRTPQEARLLVIDAVAADPVLASRVLASHDFFIGLLRDGREQCPRAAGLPELTERALVGAVTAVIGARLMSGQVDRLAEMQTQLLELVLMPYLGAEEAHRVATEAKP
jgi:AcrR family transcriptional regulator